MAYPVTNMTAQVLKERHIIAEWEKNHFFRKSDSIVNSYIAVHKDTNEPCYTNPCTEGLKLQKIGIDINMEPI